MKRIIALILILILTFGITSTALAEDSTSPKVESIKTTCLAAASHPLIVRQFSGVIQVLVRNSLGKYVPTNVYITQDAGFVSYALSQAGASSGKMTYNQLKSKSVQISAPRNGALMFTNNLVGFYFDGFVYYSTVTKFMCVEYVSSAWVARWFNGL